MTRYVPAWLIGGVAVCVLCAVDGALRGADGALRGADSALRQADGALREADWPRFRGAGGLGISDAEGLPLQWSEKDGVAWKIRLPGPGSSSPIVARGRAFVTCFSGYGVEGESGDAEKLERHLVCADIASGRILWSASSRSTRSVTRAGGFGVREHGYASSTPVTDGYRVYAFFGSSGVAAYDLDGRQVWQAKVGDSPTTNQFGSGSSPILYEELVIVPATVESEAIIAFDRKTGEEKWRAAATGYGGAWTTPIVVDAGEDKELIVSLPDELWALNPENGKLRWYAVSSISGGAVCPSAVVENGVIFAVGGRAGRAIAIRAGGRGDVTQSHAVWSVNSGSYVPSPVAYRGHVYWANDRGVVYCLDAKNGETVFRERLEDAGGIYASMHAAGDRLYVVTRRSGTFVLAAKPEFKVLARNELPSDESDFNASPAVADGRLFLRSNRFLYCIGAGSKSSGD